MFFFSMRNERRQSSIRFALVRSRTYCRAQRTISGLLKPTASRTFAASPRWQSSFSKPSSSRWSRSFRLFAPSVRWRGSWLRLANSSRLFVDTPLYTCEQRDPKGYRKAHRGELRNFTAAMASTVIADLADRIAARRHL
jgi:hypothetical protein